MAISRPSDGGFFLAELTPRIGDLLVARGLITADQLGHALASSLPGERLGEALVRLRIVFEDDLVRTLASQLGLEYVDLGTSGVDAGCARLLAEPVARRLDAVPVRVTTSGSVLVAVADPLDLDLPLLEASVGAPVELKIAELSAVRTTLDRVWGTAPAAEQDAPSAPHRIRPAEPGRAPALRDYFRRLGADATVAPGGTVEVAAGSLPPVGAGEDAAVEAYVRAWTALTGAEAGRLRD